MECPQTLPLLKRLYDLSALPLRGGKALRHPAHLSDSPGSDSSRGAPDSAVFSVDGKVSDSDPTQLARTGGRTWSPEEAKLANQLANKELAVKTQEIRY